MQMSPCEYEVLEVLSKREAPHGEFVSLETLKRELEGHDEDVLKRALNDLRTKQFVELKNGDVAITEMGIAAVSSM